MSQAVYDFVTPDGQKSRRAESFQTGRLELRERPDGGIEVIGVHETSEVRRGSQVLRQATRSEEVLATYPAGTRVTRVA